MLFRKLIAITIMGLAVPLLTPDTGMAGAAEDEAAIRAIWESYSAARVAGDADTWLSLWDQDGIQMPPGIPARGKDVLEQGVPKAFAAMPATSMRINPEEIQLMGDWAYSRGTYAADQVVQGNPVKVDGKFLTIFKRQPDGSWKIYRDIFNSNTN